MMATLPRKYLLISPTPSLHILFRVSSSRIQVNLIGCVIQKRCTYIKSILETISVCKKCVFKTLISCKIVMGFLYYALLCALPITYVLYFISKISGRVGMMLPPPPPPPISRSLSRCVSMCSFGHVRELGL